MRLEPVKSQNSVNITLLTYGILLNILILENDKSFHSMLWCLLASSWCCIQVSSPVTIWCRQASPSSQYHCKNYAHFHTCPFGLKCEVLWHPPCTVLVIAEVLVDDELWRSIADIQLPGYISDSHPFALLKWSINSINITCCSWSTQRAKKVFINNVCPAILEPFHPFVHIPLPNTIHTKQTFFCKSWWVLPLLTTKTK